MAKQVRVASLSDAKRMLEIYSPFVRSTAVSFEVEVPSLADFSKRISSSSDQFPWLVCEIDGVIAGYAYGSEHRSRCAYSWSCDASVYVDADYRRLGIGRSLYESLFFCLKAQGYFNVFAGITQPNEASVGLHERFGFTKVGTYQNVGFKFDVWHDVSWYQLRLRSEGVPAAPTPFSEIQGRI